jgi:hypothetical protein
LAEVLVNIEVLSGAWVALFELLARRLPLWYALRLFDIVIIVQACAVVLMLFSGFVTVLFGGSWFGPIGYVFLGPVGGGAILVGLAGLHQLWIFRARIPEVRSRWPEAVHRLRASYVNLSNLEE